MAANVLFQLLQRSRPNLARAPGAHDRVSILMCIEEFTRGAVQRIAVRPTGTAVGDETFTSLKVEGVSGFILGTVLKPFYC